MATMADPAKLEELTATQARESLTLIASGQTPQNLPAELILSICDYLLPDDILCLSLCTHHLFAVLARQREIIQEGRQRLRDLRQLHTELTQRRLQRMHQRREVLHYRRRPNIRYQKGLRENFSFLRRLERDLPTQYACANCFILHDHGGSELVVREIAEWQWRIRAYEDLDFQLVYVCGQLLVNLNFPLLDGHLLTPTYARRLTRSAPFWALEARLP